MRREHFRFFCRAVLPLVYDESLSYYELLCKLVDYVNNIIGDVDELRKLYYELRSYVDNYFKSLDITEEINRKLDEMAESGELADIITAYMKPPVNSILLGRPFIAPDAWGNQPNLYNIGYNQWITMWDALASQYGMTRHESALSTHEPTETEIAERNLPGAFDARHFVWYEHRAGMNQFIGDNLEGFNDSRESHPTLFVVGAIHGDEKQAIYTFYELLKSWFIDEHYGRYILGNFDIVVVPCANPYGWQYNTRNNERGVNLNRNFKFGWDDYDAPEYGADGKGASALSEPGAQFLSTFIARFAKPGYRSGVWELDLHGFHRDLHVSDNRLLWFVSNDDEMRRSTERVSGYLLEAEKKRYPELFANRPGVTWNAQGSSPTFDNDCRVRGIRAMVVECPQRFEGNASSADEDEYSFKSGVISGDIVGNVVINLCDLMFDRWDNVNYNRASQIGCVIGEYTLGDIAKNLTSGSAITLSVATNNQLQDELPSVDGNVHYGILEARNNGGSSLTAATTFRWTVGDGNHVYSWVGYANTLGVFKGWSRADSGVITLNQLIGIIDDDAVTRETVTIQNVLDNMPTGCKLECVVTSGMTSLYSELNGLGTLEVIAPEDDGSEVYADFHSATNNYQIQYTKRGSTVRKFPGHTTQLFNDYSYTRFSEFVANLRAGIKLSGLLGNDNPLAVDAPVPVKGIYTMTIVGQVDDRHGLLDFTPTDSVGESYRTVVTPTSVGEWSLITKTFDFNNFIHVTTFNEFINMFPAGCTVEGYVTEEDALHDQMPEDIANGFVTLRIFQKGLGGNKWGSITVTNAGTTPIMYVAPYVKKTGNEVAWSKVTLV